jgi:serine/threonine-protein kinase
MSGPSYTGKTLGGRYAVGELLGEGGWGAVYAAVQSDLGRNVALKILHVDVALASDAVSRFQREARAAAALGHPNIVQVTDFQANPGEPPFLVMERLTGATLGTLLRQQKTLPMRRVASIAFQMLSALGVAHGAGIVHRDVKPDNVFLVSMPGIDDFVKLLDFGIAKLSAENQAQLTGKGEMLGSPAFMSPEQVRSQEIDARSDIYAVGATMYFALSGRLPFDATNLAALLVAIMDHPPKPLAPLVPELDPLFAALVERALEKDPSRRFASAEEMRVALEPWTTGGRGFASPRRVSLATQAPSLPPSTGATSSPAAMFVTNPPAGVVVTGPVPIPLSPHAASFGPQSLPAGPTGPLPSHGPPVTGYALAQTPAVYAPAPVPMPPRTEGRSLALVIGLAVAGLVVVVAGVGGTAFYLSRKDAPAPPSSGIAPAASAPGAPLASAAPSSSVNPASATAAHAGTGARPGPTPTPALGVVDAGGGHVAVVDAGATARRQFGGTAPKISGGVFEKYDIDKSKAALQRVMPQLTQCFVTSEFDPPDHQFTSWTLLIDAAGNVLSVRRTTSVDPHPKLDLCVTFAFRASKWQAIPGGGNPRVDLTARNRDNP